MVDVSEVLAALEREAAPLDPGPEVRNAHLAMVAASAERFMAGLDTAPAFVGTSPDSVLTGPGPTEHGIGMDEAVAFLEREVMHSGANPASGRHLAYIPGSSLHHAALADYLGSVVNKYSAIHAVAPGAVHIEQQMIRWVASLVGYPDSAAGYIASGGSMANFTAIVTAREAAGLRSVDVTSAVVYLTTQSHHSVVKGLRLAGLGDAVLRIVAVDERHRMRPDILARSIAADRDAGLRPWLIVASAGTTDTGAVDPIDAIAAVARRERCWLHVDAAYGGFFLLTDDGRSRLAGIDLADSVTLDPHKGLFLPWGTGVLLVRDGGALRAAHAHSAAYLQDVDSHPDVSSPADLSPELSRPFRGLRIWLPLLVAGVAPFRAALAEKLLLARYFRTEAARLHFEVGPEPDLSIVTFRWVPDGLGADAVDQVNQGLLETLLKDGRYFISSTVLDGRYTLRVAILSFRTHRADIDGLLEQLRLMVSCRR